MPNALPGLGNTWPMYAMRQNLMTLFGNFYEKGQGMSMIGFYDLTAPGILLRDPELIKSVLLTNFNKFNRNIMFLDEQKDPILAKNPFFSTGDKWKMQRAQLTRMLSSAKLRMIFNQIQDVCDKMDFYVDGKFKVSTDTVELEMKRFFSRFTSEIAANSVFGVEGYSFDDDYEGRSFLNIGETIFSPSMMTGLKTTIALFFPFLSNIFDSRLMPKDIDADLRRMIDSVVDERLNRGIVKSDILQVILESDKAEQIDKDYVLAHAGIFFFDIYETSSTAMTFVAFHLATNLDVQERVREEVASVLAKHNKGQLTYEALKDLTYMDQVINESARLNPALGTMSRICTERCELVGSDGLSFVAEPGNIVSISIQGLHHDPQHWPDPQKFDPERFSEENKSERHKFVHLPFGEGPRMCPGRVLGSMIMKSAFAELLGKYSLTLSSRQKLPLKLNPYHFLTNPLDGVWINMERLT